MTQLIKIILWGACFFAIGIPVFVLAGIASLILWNREIADAGADFIIIFFNQTDKL